MLFQEVIKKSNELESSLVGNKLLKETIVSFLDALSVAIPIIHEPNNYGSALSVFMMWETILYESYNREFYKGRLPYKLKQENKISVDLINEQLSVFLKIREIQPSKNIENKINYFMVSNPIEAFDDDLAQSSPEILTMIQQSNIAYKKSDIKTSSKHLKKIISNIKNQKKMDSISIFYLGWAIHAQGNNLYIDEKNSESLVYYKIALNLKEKLLEDNCSIPRGLLLYSYFTTKSRYIYQYQFLKSNSYINTTINKLENVLDEVKKYKVELETVNPLFYNNLHSNIKYYLGKNYIYNSNNINIEELTKGLKCFNESIKLSYVTKDIPSVLRGTINKYTFEPNISPDQRIDGIKHVLQTIKDDTNFKVSTKDPNVRVLLGKSHLAEYIIEVSKDFSNKLFSTCNEFGIFPIEKLNLDLIHQI
ncbi:MAG: hypothetical protein PHZ02_15290 [Desulfocapsaceae bacterium]|nr:hypothetical protein [Desulfocapsaceae bacterium]